MNKYVPFLTLAFLLSLIAISTYNLNKKQAVKAQNNDNGPSIHFFKTEISLPEFSLNNLEEGEENFSKKDLLGKKYTLINFFASWCGTCRAEHEILMRLQKSGIIDMYGVAWHDIADNTKNYLKQSGNPFKKVALDPKGSLSSVASIKAIPETWIVDENGTIVWMFRGNLQDFSIAEIQNIVLQ